jgi:hypothetical protein
MELMEVHLFIVYATFISVENINYVRPKFVLSALIVSEFVTIEGFTEVVENPVMPVDSGVIIVGSSQLCAFCSLSFLKLKK